MSGRVRSSPRHRKHNRFRPLDLLLVHGEALHVTHAGDHAKDILQRPHLPHHLELGEEIVEIERGRPQLPLHPRGFLFVERLRRFLDQANDVAHAENPPRQAIRDEGSNWSSFSPTPANLIGRCVTSRIESAAPPRASPSSLVRMIPVMPERLVEMRGHADRLLTSRRIGHQQDFLRLQEFLELL